MKTTGLTSQHNPHAKIAMKDICHKKITHSTSRTQPSTIYA